jgi:hypothetical protein
MKTLFLAGLTAITMLACTNKTIDADYNPQLPAATQTGAWTFGCKINGVIMIPQNAKIQGNPGGSLTKGLEFSDNLVSKSIEATDSQYNRGGVLIKIPNEIINTGDYLIQPIQGGFETTNENVLYMQVFKNGKFYGSIENTGKVNFTRNDATVISGTFYCKLKNKDNANDIIEVTEGRFDIKK